MVESLTETDNLNETLEPDCFDKISVDRKKLPEIMRNLTWNGQQLELKIKGTGLELMILNKLI